VSIHTYLNIEVQRWTESDIVEGPHQKILGCVERFDSMLKSSSLRILLSSSYPYIDTSAGAF
jgi:hypothetical protein